MADPELEEIRKQRLAQMQAQFKVILNTYLRLCSYHNPEFETFLGRWESRKRSKTRAS